MNTRRNSSYESFSEAANKDVYHVSYYDCDRGLFLRDVKILRNVGFRRIQRPHCKLPDLLEYWDETLKWSDRRGAWYSIKIKGRKKATRAVVGSHLVPCIDLRTGETSEEEHFVIVIFGEAAIRNFKAGS